MAAAWGCGLEYFPELLNPPVGPLAGGDYFQFEATYLNGDPNGDPGTEDDDGIYPDEEFFRGFELHYKIYDIDQVSLIIADQAVIAVFDDLQTRGYRRIQKASDSTLAIEKPLIFVHPDDRGKDNGKSYTVTISFRSTDLAPPYPQIEISQAAPPLLHKNDMEAQDLRREVNYTSPGNPTEYKRFNDFVEPVDVVDADIAYDPAIWAAIKSNQPVTLVLYALSYGFIPEQNRQFYSQPVKLGDISITFPADTY